MLDSPDCTAHISALPLHVLGAIFSSFDQVGDLARAASTCRTWQAVITSGVWSNARVVLVQRWSSGLGGGLQWVAAHCPGVQKVDASGCSALQEVALKPLTTLPLQHLNLSQLWGFQGTATLRALCGGGQLRSLDLSDTSISLNDELARALAQAPSLQGLYLSNARPHRHAARFLDRLSDACPRLRSLDISGCAWLPAAATGTGQRPRWPGLGRLNLAGCSQVADLDWLHLTRSALTALDLSGTAVSDYELSRIATDCEMLAQLSIARCLRVLGPGLVDLAAGAAVGEGCLRQLTLSELPRISDSCLRILLAAVAGGCRRDSRQTGLKLDLSNCGGIRDGSLIALIPDESLSGAQPTAHDTVSDLSDRLSSASLDVSNTLEGTLNDAVGERRSRDATVAPLGVSDPLLTGADGHQAGTVPHAAVPKPGVPLAPFGEPFVSSLQLAGEPSDWAQVVPAEPQLNPSATGARSAVTASDGAAAAPLRLEELRLAGCAGLSAVVLDSLAAGGILAHLRVLDLRHLEALRKPQGLAPVIPRMARAAGGRLEALLLDGCALDEAACAATARACPCLTQLSLIACKGLPNAGLLAFAAHCTRLKSLAVGGSGYLWREASGLAAFSGLMALRIARRHSLQAGHLLPPFLDEDLAVIAARHPALESLTLAGCGEVTDAGLQALPPSLRHLLLVACERVRGGSLYRLSRLRTLRLNGCPRVTPAAVQVIAAACLQLRTLELPSTLPLDCLPVQASSAGHLSGIRLEGGMQPHVSPLHSSRSDGARRRR